MTHTPGPWNANAIKNNSIIGDESAVGAEKIHINGGNQTIAVVYRPEDARLIKAAPELLEALIECAERLHSWEDHGESVTAGHYYHMAREAIKKATA